MKIEELSLSALKYFVDAVDLRSITLSADKNHVTRPAVSQAIMRLEAWSGQTFLQHEKRSFVLTEAGKSFYRRAKTSFSQLNDCFSAPPAPDLSFRMGCSASLIDLVFPLVQTSLRQCIDPQIKIGTTDYLLRQLRERQIHIAFVIEEDSHRGIESRQFHRGKFELRSKSGRLKDTLVTTEDRREVEQLRKFAHRKKIEFARHLKVESWTVAARIATLLNGCCLVPDFLSGNDLRPISIPGWNVECRAVAMTLKSVALSSIENECLQNAVR